MIKKILEQITIITDDESDNLENYLDALNYLDNIYKLVTKLTQISELSLSGVDFLPSFKGKNLSDRLGIMTTSKENELKYFKAKSSQFTSDKIKKRIFTVCEEMCETILVDKDIIAFTLI